MIIFQNVLMNREEAVVDIEDRGYQFGDGVYEVIRVYDGEFFAFQEHIERLERSTGEIRLAMPMPASELKDQLVQLVEKNELANGFVYLQITRGTAPRTHHFPEHRNSILTAYTKVMERPLRQLKNGISTILADDIRWLRCDIKSLNLLGNVLAKQDAKDLGCTEAIFHRGETVTEGSSSNVFIVKDGVLRTHPANNLILNGITRLKVFEMAAQLGIEIEEQSFTVDELFAADEVFITSTTSEITPVVRIGESLIGRGNPGEVTERLQAAFEKAIFGKSYVKTN